MTRGTTDWTQAKIYKMTCPDGHYYYGSTCMPLSKRKSWHKKAARTFPERKAYKHFNNVGWNVVKIELVQDVDNCSCNVELKRAEDVHIKEVLGETLCLNILRANRSYKEWWNDTRDVILEKRKEHYAENRDEILPKRREYYQKNKDAINKNRKKYEDEHRQQINARSKKYREDHKATIASNQIVTCDRCGFSTAKTHLARHKKSQKCINFTPTEASGTP